MKRYDPNRPDLMTGGEPIPKSMNNDNKPKHHPLGDKTKARDGFDNTGTQGYDSLSDEGFTGSSNSAGKEGSASHTGSSSEDFRPSLETDS